MYTLRGTEDEHVNPIICDSAGLLDDLSPAVGTVQLGSTSARGHARTQHVKVAVFGRSGVGKTSTVAKLCGVGEDQYFQLQKIPFSDDFLCTYSSVVFY